MKTDWAFHDEDGRVTIYRKEVPLGLWLLDRWLRIPDFISDWIEWRLPVTSPLTRIPCLLYSAWNSALIQRSRWTVYDAMEQSDTDPEQGLTNPV